MGSQIAVMSKKFAMAVLRKINALLRAHDSGAVIAAKETEQHRTSWHDDNIEVS